MSLISPVPDCITAHIYKDSDLIIECVDMQSRTIYTIDPEVKVENWSKQDIKNYIKDILELPEEAIINVSYDGNYRKLIRIKDVKNEQHT